jgi:hypothetical protein
MYVDLLRFGSDNLIDGVDFTETLEHLQSLGHKPDISPSYVLPSFVAFDPASIEV